MSEDAGSEFSAAASTGAVDICCCDLHSKALAENPTLSTHFCSVSNYRELPKELSSLLEAHCKGNTRRSGSKICKACVAMIHNLYKQQKDKLTKKRKASSSPKQEGTFVFDDFIQDLKTQQFSQEQLEIILAILGQIISTGLAAHVAEKCSPTAQTVLEEMTALNATNHWHSTYSPIRHFFQGIIDGVAKSRVRDSSETAIFKRDRLLYHSVETLYGAMNARYLSSFALAEMLYIYFLSSSRRATETHAASSGVSSFRSLQRALSEVSSVDPPMPQNGYTVVAFDNNQVLGKTYRIQLGSKFRVKVVTTVSAFTIQVTSNPQQHNSSFPMYINLDDKGKADLTAKLLTFHQASKQCVISYLHKFLEDKITQFNKPEVFNKETLEDCISSELTPPQRTEMNYFNVATSGYDCEIYDQPCILTNPNSYKNVAFVLDKILSSFVNNDRKWITVVADGLPYSIAQELIRNWVNCTECSDSFLESDAKEHFSEKHNMAVPPSLQRKFSKILIRPGAGHYEMNLLRSIFSEWFNIFIEPIAELMGFLTAKAKLFCASAHDHHKSWQMIEIIFDAMTDELMFAYLKHFYQPGNHEQGQLPNVQGFISTFEATSNEYIKGAFQFVYEFVFPLVLFRSAIRQCNFEVALKSREYASAVFYAFRHPKYQKINCYDMAELLQIPTHFREAVYNESFRIPNSKAGQGIDFLLEQRNKALKAFVVHNGIPTDEQWMVASRSLPKLEEIVDAVCKRVDLTIPSASEHSSTLAEEKTAVRRYIRSTERFDLSMSLKLVNTDDIEVSPEFLKCREIGEKNQKTFYEDFIKTGKARQLSVVSAVPIVKPSSNWTVVKLKAEIKMKSQFVPEDQRKQFIHGLAACRKDDLIQRYNSIMQLIEEMENPVNET